MMNRDDLSQRALGAYLGLAVGDALGATVEFMLPREIKAKYGIHDRICGGGWLNLPAGDVTDDTTMALSLGQAIVQAGAIDDRTIAQAFDDWMRGKPVDIGHTVRRGILNFRRIGATQVPPNEQDAGNGACMRVLPIALATLGQSADEVRAACRIQAHITHNNILSDAGTECVVFMIQAALQGATCVDLLHGQVRHLVEHYPIFRFRARRRLNPSGYIVETLQAVFQALFDTDTFQDCLVDVVNRGGDADTTGAIAGMIAGAVYGAAAIPPAWLQALDRTIQQRCRDQTQALLQFAPVFNQEADAARSTHIS